MARPAFWHASLLFELFLNFLAPQDVLASSCIFPAPGLEPNISLQGAPVAFTDKWCLETEVQMLGWSLLPCAPAAGSSQQAELGNVSAPSNPETHTQLHSAPVYTATTMNSHR